MRDHIVIDSLGKIYIRKIILFPHFEIWYY